MARALHKLTDRQVRNATAKGRLSDGGGLYLRVTPSPDSVSRSWSFVWTRDGRKTELAIGPYPAISLSDAREIAAGYRSTVAKGGNPAEEKATEAEPTFAECVDLFLASMEGGWSNAKHRSQWRMTLGDEYCRKIRDKRVSEIALSDVLAVLRPIWAEKPETASRLRGRIERVLNYAKVHGHRDGENPAQWRGNLDAILPKQKKRATVKHHAAMAYADVPAFMAQLGTRHALAADALAFLILTAARTGEVINAAWDEIDFDARVWTVPAERMKMRKEHAVPLTDEALAILRPLHDARVSQWIFPGTSPKKPMSNMAMNQLLKRMDRDSITVHGFRSSFRDWAGDETSFPREIAEGCLAHAVGDETERAYRRRDAIEKRRKLLEAWAQFCAGQSGAKVVPLRA